MPDPVGRNLQEILEECDPPTNQCRNNPWLGIQILEMPVPRKGHEDIAAREQKYGDPNLPHRLLPLSFRIAKFAGDPILKGEFEFLLLFVELFIHLLDQLVVIFGNLIFHHFPQRMTQ